MTRPRRWNRCSAIDARGRRVTGEPGAHNRLARLPRAHPRQRQCPWPGSRHAAPALLLDAGRLVPEEIARRLSLTLSRGNDPAQCARWLEGFLSGSGLLLIHDDRLLRPDGRLGRDDRRRNVPGTAAAAPPNIRDVSADRTPTDRPDARRPSTSQRSPAGGRDDAAGAQSIQSRGARRCRC